MSSEDMDLFLTEKFRNSLILDDRIERDRAKSDCDMRSLKNSRQQLSAKRLNRVVKRLKKKYRLIYLELSKGATIIVRFIRNIDRMTTKSLKSIRFSLSFDIFVNEERDDAARKRIELFTKKRTRFFQIHEHMNIHFAFEFDYESACVALDLDSTKSLMLDQHKSQSQFIFLKTLKSHQVTVLVWALDTEAAIGGQLIADDMGVGKIVLALSLIMEIAYLRGLPRPQGSAAELVL